MGNTFRSMLGHTMGRRSARTTGLSVDMQRGAVFDATDVYRYRLSRAWDPALPTACFIMLNPSVADAHVDDPTIRRCIGFARTWGYGALDVVNLFAYRTTEPRVLAEVADPVGPKNDAHILRALAGSSLVVAAWGCHGSLHGRADEVTTLLGDRETAHLGSTRDGHPRHPLYLRKDLIPIHASPSQRPRAEAPSRIGRSVSRSIDRK